MKKVAILLAIFGFSAATSRALPQVIAGNLDVLWNEGAADCEQHPQPPLQVHEYEPQTFIIRQSPCSTFEANFLYLLVGADKALLIDTGDVEDPAKMPLAETVTSLLAGTGDIRPKLMVLHSHGHSDHRAGDTQFAALAHVQNVPSDAPHVRKFFGFEDWPNGVAQIDLGGRTVDVIPAPGHDPDHFVFYDDRTGILFTGDFPARPAAHRRCGCVSGKCAACDRDHWVAAGDPCPGQPYRTRFDG